MRGSYTADCVKPDCAMNVLRRKKEEEDTHKTRGRRNSTRSLKAFRPSSAAAGGLKEGTRGFVGTTAFRGSQESLLSNLGEKEVLENVESSV